MKDSSSEVSSTLWMKNHILKIRISSSGVDKTREYLCDGCNEVFKPTTEGVYWFNALVVRKATKVSELFCDNCIEESRRVGKHWRKLPILTDDQVPKKERQLVRRAVVGINYE
ncbi:MAG: hypothetical protein JRN52_14015 [Nitrososphaerota archaeon]|nr:hypothetical protein [Nitrososphaerota archaeon]